jgi:site-specific recombinase XerD
MASVFQRGRSKIWIAAFRAWDAGKGAFVWVQKSTGTRDAAAAAGIAATLERASGDCKAGSMTRERAIALVDDILKLAGLSVMAKVPTLRAVADDLLASVEVSAGSLRKYSAQWDNLAAWAGKKADLPVSTITVDDMQEFYADARKRFSGTTANAHLNFASMVFRRAVAHGHRTSNPTEAVTRKASGAVEKLTFGRSEVAAMIREARRAKKLRLEWQCLIALGWHSGHRIQDLLDITAASIEGDLLTMQPRKKAQRGGRQVVLPLPRWLAKKVQRLGSFKALHRADNRNGKVSEDFVALLRRAGIDPQPKKRGERVVHLKSFHSFRHSMSSRLTAAGVSDEMARLVTDHDSIKVARKYRHAEVQALREALALARSRR